MSEPRLELVTDCPECGQHWQGPHSLAGVSPTTRCVGPGGSRRVLDPEQVVWRDTEEHEATLTVRDIIEALAALEGRER